MSEKSKISESIGMWPSRPINLQGEAAQADARVKAGRASAKKKSATQRRLIRFDGTVRVMQDVATELGITAARLAELYDKGLRTTARIRAMKGFAKQTEAAE